MSKLKKKLKEKTQKVDTFRIPGCRKSVQTICKPVLYVPSFCVSTLQSTQFMSIYRSVIYLSQNTIHRAVSDDHYSSRVEGNGEVRQELKEIISKYNCVSSCPCLTNDTPPRRLNVKIGSVVTGCLRLPAHNLCIPI